MKKQFVTLVASLLLAQFPNGASAQQTPPAAWAGWARCQITVQGPGYTDQQTHTWTITGGAPTAQGAFQTYAGTWAVVGGGSLSRTQGTQTLMAQWATNGPNISAPIAVFVRASDKRMFIQARHAQLRSAAAIQGYQQVTIAGKPQTPGKINAEAFEWAFPVIAVSAPVPPDRNATATGSSTSPLNGSVGPMQPAGSQGTASCTWQFGHGSAAPAPPPTLAAQPIPTPNNPATNTPPANNPPGTSTPPGTTTPPPGSGTHAIRVTMPSGGETWLAGVLANLTWTHDYGDAQTFDVDFSGNGGQTWSSLQRGVRPDVLAAATREYATSVRLPATPTTNGVIRVSAAGNPAAAAVSGNRFTLVSPGVSLTSPAAGATWTIGSDAQITWSINVPGGVYPAKLEISRDGGTTWTDDGTIVPEGIERRRVWRVTSPATTRARVRITLFDRLTSTVLGAPAESGNFTIADASGGPAGAGARLLSITPTTVEQGGIGTAFTFTGVNTHWQSATPVVSVVPGIGVPITRAQAASATELVAGLDVQYSTPPGPRTVTITTGTEVVTLHDAFTVTAREKPELISVTPSRGRQGQQNLTVQLTGRATRWAQGQTRVAIAKPADTSQPGAQPPPQRVTVLSTTVHSPTRATAVVNIAADAEPGSYWFSVFDAAPSDWLMIVDGFTVEAATSPLPANVSRLLSIAPASIEQGVSASDEITLTGEGTHWQQGTTTVNFGPGVTIQGGVRVVSPTSLTTHLSVGYAAAHGPRTISVTTGNEIVTLPNALTIIAREQPVITQISPNSAPAGAQNLTVTFTGRGTRWEQGKTNFLLHNAPGLTQASAISVNSPTSMTVSLNIAPSAAPGPREITVLNAGVVVGSDIITVANAFTVNSPGPADAPRIISVTPNAAEQGVAGYNVTLNGQLTHWERGTPVVSFGPGVTMLGQPHVLSAGRLSVLLQITYAAAQGPRAITVTTGAEVVSLANAFTITARAEPRIESITANTAAAGSQNVPVVFVGSGTRWVQGQTHMTFSGTGIRVVGDPTVNSPTRMTAILSIDPTATPGARDVTVLNGGPVIGAPIPDDTPIAIASDVLLAPGGFTVSPPH
jgi:hypothetical protein